ncbi:beta-galactosidase-like [Dorcoceras hygrometricum]|uniref:Beta-galactosidase-like n=1 Tax=Dorcoceras hygrometricum TaxID=472368 RepID=A0A2Z7DL15_9LAMI|nr:beta-galactosidase-like [Dorcoceras hygrometricum]
MNAGSSSEMRQRDDVLCRKPDASSFRLRRTRVNASSFRGIQIYHGGRNLLALFLLRSYSDCTDFTVVIWVYGIPHSGLLDVTTWPRSLRGVKIRDCSINHRHEVIISAICHAIC